MQLRVASAIVAGTCLASAAAGQEQPPRVLENLALVTQDAEQAGYILHFTPGIPEVNVLDKGTDHLTVIVRNSLRSPRVAPPAPGAFVRGLEFRQDRADMIIRFKTTTSALATIEPVDDNRLQIRLQPGTLRPAPTNDAPDTPLRPQQISAPEQRSDYRRADGAFDRSEMILLRYADVSEVIGLLVEGSNIQPNNVFIRREPGFGSLAQGNQSSYPPAMASDRSTALSLGQSFANGLAIDRRLNAIWVTGSADRIAQVKDQVALIDLPVDSVILETQFVELTETGARNLGIDLTNNAGQIAVGRIETGAVLPFNVAADDVLPTGVLQAAIYAQVERGEGRILSRPRIAAQSGSTAKIITGDALPILTAITLSGVNGVSQQVQYVNVGVTLQIAPRVTADGFVTSQIYGVVSSVTGYSQGYPTISQREAETSASVRDGETFVIGGLTQENVIANKSRVPLLGDLPLLGGLFRRERSTRSKTELYIVITPRIVRHGQDPADDAE